MLRRAFVAATAAAPVIGPLSSKTKSAQVAVPNPVTWRRFEITTKVTLQNSPGEAQLWLPLAQTAAGYQMATDVDWEGNGRAELVRDPIYGAQILRSTWDGSANPQHMGVRQTVVTCDRAALPMVPISQAEREFWVTPTESAPTDGVVRNTVERIVAGRTNPRERLHAIYDWVVATTWRNPDTPGCGSGDIRVMLETGNFGGKCADINGLMVGLARAAGIPARDVYGIRVAELPLVPLAWKER